MVAYLVETVGVDTEVVTGDKAPDLFRANICGLSMQCVQETALQIACKKQQLSVVRFFSLYAVGRSSAATRTAGGGHLCRIQDALLGGPRIGPKMPLDQKNGPPRQKRCSGQHACQERCSCADLSI